MQALTCIIMKARRDVFQAISDPTRRDIIGLIAGKPQNVNSIAEHFSVSRQAISLHMQILADCGLVVMKQQGRERLCEARLKSLNEVSEWIDQYRAHWEERLDRLDNYLEKIKKEKYGKRRK